MGRVQSKVGCINTILFLFVFCPPNVVVGLLVFSARERLLLSPGNSAVVVFNRDPAVIAPTVSSYCEYALVLHVFYTIGHNHTGTGNRESVTIVTVPSFLAEV